MSKVCLVQLCEKETWFQEDHPLSVCNVAEPLGILSIEAYLESFGHSVLLLHPAIDTKWLSADEMLSRILRYSPDIIAFSAMTCQIPATRSFAGKLRKMLKKARFVLGGDHISGYPQGLRDYGEFDVAICGEGERSMAWVTKNQGSIIEAMEVPSGIYWKEQGQLRGSGRSERIKDIDSLPDPTRHQSLIAWSKVGALMWPPKSQQKGMASVYGSRGCTYACPYCDAQQVWGNGIVWRSTNRIVGELRRLHDIYGVNTAFFVDLTFNCDRDRMLDICVCLSKANLDISWYVLLRPANGDIKIDREMLEALKNAGCTKIGLGIETLSSAIGRDLHRGVNEELLLEIVSHLDKLGILSKVFLMIGHPDETMDYYRHLTEFLKRLGPDEVRLSFLTPFPGTPLWASMREQISCSIGYEDYTTFRPILQHPLFTEKELREIRKEILAGYYFSDTYMKHVQCKIDRHPHLKQSFAEFMEDISSQLKGNVAGEWKPQEATCTGVVAEKRTPEDY